MKNGKLRVALVGVSFGAEFVPIYLKHPDVDSLVLVDTNRELLDTIGNKFLLEERLTDFSTMLEDETIDAVHLVTPPATHAPMSIQVMNAGKHCACTILFRLPHRPSCAGNSDARSLSHSTHRPHIPRPHEAPAPLRTVAGLSAAFQCLRCHHSFHRHGLTAYKEPCCKW